MDIKRSLKPVIYVSVVILLNAASAALAQEDNDQKTSKDTATPSYTQPIFDDKMLLDGYTHKYRDLSQDVILEMIKDDTLSNYKTTAAVRVFSEKFAPEIVSKEKRSAEKILLRRLKETDSPFVQVEIMCTLCEMDRYRYFKSMVPALIQKLGHYNSTVNQMAFKCLDEMTSTANGRAREARIVFNTLRKILFLSRKRLEKIVEPDDRLAQQLKLLRWSVKTLGSEELKRLPKEIMHLL